MNRRKLAVMLALAMTVTVAPMSRTTVRAEECLDGFVAETAAEATEDGGKTAEEDDFAEMFAESEEGFVSENGGTEQEMISESEALDIGEDEGVVFEDYSDSYYPDMNAQVILDATAYSATGNLTYQWQIEDQDNVDERSKIWIDIPEANDVQYVIEHANKTAYYRCVVSNGIDTAIATRYVEVDSGFECIGDEMQYFTVKPGESVEMTAEAKTTLGGELIYQWIIYNDENKCWEKIESAVSDRYVAHSISKNTKYRCKISDGCNWTYQEYSVSIDSGLEAEVIGAQVVYVGKGETPVLKVSAKSNYPLQYQWEKTTEDIKNEYKPIEGATEAEYTVTSVQYKQEYYSCHVTDGYNETWVLFKIVIKSGLSTSGTVIVHASLGEKIKLTAEAATEYGTLTYKWSKLDTENMIWREIPDATGKEMETDAITSKDPYRCIVDNGYEGAVIEFRIHLMTEKVDKEATCGEAGSKHKECSVCDTKEASTEIPATGKHSYGEYSVTKEATAVAEGTKVRTCSVCGAVDSAVVPKISGTIQVAASEISLQIKKSIALEKLVTGFAVGDSIDVAACTSSNASVAAIENGAVKAKKAGTTVVTIKLASGVSAQVTVTVQKKAVATTSINVVKNVTLAAGEKQKLTPVVSPITTLNKVTYSSSNKKVATVANDGTITAKKSGTATIKVKCGKKTVNVKVKVTKKAPTGMTGVPATKTLKKGKSFTLKAKLTPSGSEAKITYKSSNSKVVSVSAKGKVKAKKKGTATITVKAGNITKTCVVTVK